MRMRTHACLSRHDTRHDPREKPERPCRRVRVLTCQCAHPYCFLSICLYAGLHTFIDACVYSCLYAGTTSCSVGLAARPSLKNSSPSAGRTRLCADRAYACTCLRAHPTPHISSQLNGHHSLQGCAKNVQHGQVLVQHNTARHNRRHVDMAWRGAARRGINHVWTHSYTHAGANVCARVSAHASAHTSV